MQTTCINGIARTPPTSLSCGICCTSFSKTTTLSACNLFPPSVSTSASVSTPSGSWLYKFKTIITSFTNDILPHKFSN